MNWRGWAWFAAGILPLVVMMLIKLPEQRQPLVLLAFIPLSVCLRRALPYFDAADEAEARRKAARTASTPATPRPSP